MSEALQEALTQASQSLGVATDYLYEVLIAQGKVEFVWNIVTIVGAILLIVAILMFSRIAYKKFETKPYSEWDTVAFISGVTGGMGSLFAIALLPSLVKECIQIIVNPPVWVLEYLVNLVK